MLPYGIIIKQNRLILQQSLTLWQRKFGLLRPGKFIASSLPLVCVFTVFYSLAIVISEKEFSLMSLITGVVMNVVFVAFLMYLSAVKTVREYAAATKEENIQLVLKEDELEITTEFSRETVPYSEIDLCYEKDFIVTLITDKNSFPLSISKMHFVKGNYDVFVSLLKSRLPDRYEKKGEN